MTQRSVIPQARAMVGLVALQFILGMISNLYVKFPETTDPALLWHAAWTSWPVASHMVLGTLLILCGLVLLVRVIRSRKREWIGLNVVALLGLVVAGVGGEEFVKTQNDAYSLVMALGFLVAAVGYSRFLAAAEKSQALADRQPA